MENNIKQVAQTGETIFQNMFGIKRVDILRAYRMDESNDGSLIYLCYHPGDQNGDCTIVKMTTIAGDDDNKITTTEIGVGPWDNRRIVVGEEGAITWYPINGSNVISKPVKLLLEEWIATDAAVAGSPWTANTIAAALDRRDAVLTISGLLDVIIARNTRIGGHIVTATKAAGVWTYTVA